jgi:hypothetical protein
MLFFISDLHNLQQDVCFSKSSCLPTVSQVDKPQEEKLETILVHGVQHRRYQPEPAKGLLHCFSIDII